MKALLVLSLLSLIGCGAQTKKVIIDQTEKPQTPDAITAPVITEVLSILSKSPLPEKFSLSVNDQQIFDECEEESVRANIDREIPLIEIDLAEIPDFDYLKIEITDRLADCSGEEVYYLHDRVDFRISEPNKWNNSRTIIARLNNFPREIEGEPTPRPSAEPTEF